MDFRWLYTLNYAVHYEKRTKSQREKREPSVTRVFLVMALYFDGIFKLPLEKERERERDWWWIAFCVLETFETVDWSIRFESSQKRPRDFDVAIVHRLWQSSVIRNFSLGCCINIRQPNKKQTRERSNKVWYIIVSLESHRHSRRENERVEKES